jgi:hypothetical protein
MVATHQDCELISSIIKFGDIGSEATVQQGMKTTNVAGYPVILSRAPWEGSEVNTSGNNQAFLFLPYLQSGQMPIGEV